LAEQNYAFRLYPFAADFPINGINKILREDKQETVMIEQRTVTETQDDPTNYKDVATML